MGEEEDVEPVVTTAYSRIRELEKRVAKLDGRVFHGPFEVINGRRDVDDLEEYVDFVVDRVKALERGQIFIILLVSILLTAVWELRRGDG
jgi:hypothetical protein